MKKTTSFPFFWGGGRFSSYHEHGDHVWGVSYIAKEESIPVYAHKLELKYIDGEEPFPGRKKAEHLVQVGSPPPYTF